MQCLYQRWDYDMASILSFCNSSTQIHLYHDHLPNLVKYIPQHKAFQMLNFCIETLGKIIGDIVYLAYLIQFAS